MACKFIEKETLAQMFPYEFCKIFKNTFLQNTSRRLLMYNTFGNDQNDILESV